MDHKSNPNCIVVNRCQDGNPILRFIRNVSWQFGEIIPDYVLGQTTCALFLSLRYHRLHPNYIYERTRDLGRLYRLRVLLVHIDVEDHQQALSELASLSLVHRLTVILTWSPEEAGRYLETYKAYEHKPADMIKERIENDYLAKLSDCLTAVRSVNKTDVVTLASTFGSLEKIMNASIDELEQCPGFGEQKARRLHKAFNEPFILTKSDDKLPKNLPSTNSMSSTGTKL